MLTCAEGGVHSPAEILNANCVVQWRCQHCGKRIERAPLLWSDHNPDPMADIRRYMDTFIRRQIRNLT